MGEGPTGGRAEENGALGWGWDGKAEEEARSVLAELSQLVFRVGDKEIIGGLLQSTSRAWWRNGFF